MEEAVRPYVHDRLRLAESLLRAVTDSITPLQRLLAEVHKEITLALQEEIESRRDEELSGLRREVNQLRDAMVSRAVIERAKGILMQGQGLTESESFELLNEISQRQHRKLRDIAADVTSGTLSPGLAMVRPGNELPDSHSRVQRRPHPNRRAGQEPELTADT